MARRGGIRNRMELRAQAEAAERREAEDTEEVEGDEEEEEEDDEEEASEESDDSEGESEDDEDEDGGPKKKKKAKKPAPKVAKPKSRARSAKVVRMRVVWGVFSNSNQRVAVFDYPKRTEADEYAAKMTADKKSTFFVQPVKEPIEEKK